MTTRRPRVAVIGTGIAGLGAAHRLAPHADLTLYEADGRPGGHANTVAVPAGEGVVPVDTGFIVYNEQNYPLLTQLFRDVEVPTGPSDMSFSISTGGGALGYRSDHSGFLAQRSNAVRPGTWRMVADAARFSRRATRLLADDPLTNDPSLAEFLEAEGLGAEFTERLLLPVTACIWSSSFDSMMEFPARTLFRFLANHGLLNAGRRPQWRTVTGGSREYVRRVLGSVGGRVRLSTPVRAVRRTPTHVLVADSRGGIEPFDHVVLATHAPASLGMLGPDASPVERRVLGAFGYQPNRAVLHRDPSSMPARRRAWASWNYRSAGAGPDARVSLTYWMNLLQGLDRRVPLFVTLNPLSEPRGAIAEFDYEHPQFDRAAVRAQGALPAVQGLDRVWFAGAWAGYGFHEDGLRSGYAAADGLLASARSNLVAVPAAAADRPALVAGGA